MKKNCKKLVKVRDIHKTEKKNSIGIIVSGYENREKTQFIYQKNVVDNHLFLQEKKGKNAMLL